MRNLIEFCARKTTVNERISGKIPSFTVFLCRKIITIIESKDIRFYSVQDWGVDIVSSSQEYQWGNTGRPKTIQHLCGN